MALGKTRRITHRQSTVQIPREFIFQRELHVVQQVACITPHLVGDTRDLVIRVEGEYGDIMTPDEVQIQFETGLLLEPNGHVVPRLVYV